MSSQLSNYLRSHRKRAGLSQAEVAFLLGKHGSSKMCRFEHFVRAPNLETALAFEVIFQKSVRELFGGLYRQVEKQVALRAKVLSYRTGRHSGSRLEIRRHETVSQIVALIKKAKS